jgi:hypothetical protein
MKTMRGCEEDAPNPVAMVEGKYVNRCPVAMLTGMTIFMLRMRTHYEKGYLPCQGGILDQSNTFVMAMEILEDSIATEIRLREEARARKAKSGKRT